MDHIPTELLHEIFIKLHLKYKLECMLVCRLWYDTLDRRSLLDTLSVRSGIFLKLKKMIEHHPYRAKQVEILKLSADFDKRILCNMFPNLRQAIMPPYSGIERTNHLDSPFQFTHATSKLEKIVESGECELTRQLAMSNMCTSLKSLELFFSDLPGLISSDILSQLKNLPVLETLSLRYFLLKLMDLEMVHCNIPSIKSLKLSDTRIASGGIPNGVIPVIPITNLDLKLIDVADLHTHIELYKYLAKKYPSVTKPTFDDVILQLKDTRYARDIYNKGILPCYQKIGTQIDAFLFDSYCDGLDAFRKFDDYGIKLKYLDLKAMCDNGNIFLEGLFQSQQSKYVEELILTNVIPAPLEMMINMKVLTFLKIDFWDDYFVPDKPTLNFSQLIEACPVTLTDLTMEYVKLTFDESTSNITSIQNLKLDSVDITEKATITGTSFPELSVLDLSVCIDYDLAISLPNCHLKKFDVKIEYPEGANFGLSVNTMYYGKPQRSMIHPGRKHGCGGKIYCSDKPIFKSTGVMVDLTCASIEEFSYSIEEKEDSDDDDDEYY